MSIFEEVKRQLTITQVVEHYGYRVNRAHRFLCPFHNDRNPSASIKNDYFNCFVCGAGGDLITFTAKYLGLSNFDACKELVKCRLSAFFPYSLIFCKLITQATT